MADPRRLREILGFGYGAPSSAMSALEPFHAGVDPAYMPQDVVTASPGEGPSPYVRRGIEGLLGTVMPDRWASQWADKLNAVADFNPLQEAYDIGKGIGDAVQGGDKLSLAMSMIPGKAADEIVPAVKAAQKGIRAYHGSPHGFDKFDISKIGTGEGAQAYGHGLYFAENEGIARGYRDNISDSQDPLANMNMAIERLNDPQTGYLKKRLTPEFLAEQLATNPNYRSISFLKDDPDALRDFHAVLQGHNSDGTVTDEAIRAMRRIESNPNIPQKSKGHMYEVNINADPDAFLDWDKPLSEQQQMLAQLAKSKSKTVRELLASEPYQTLDQSRNVYGTDIGKITGQDLIRQLSLNMEGKTVGGKSSQALGKAGIPGIKYLDAGSRSGGEGSRNYVVFDDRIIDIVKKYGIAGALGAGLITQQMADQLEAQQGGGQS